ncbi:MAK10-like protein, partial [Tanacetum coccineum]
MATHTERIERFENAIFRQREEINDRMAEIFGLLKELTATRTPEKVLMGEEARHPITKNVNSISLIRIEEGENGGNNRINEKLIEGLVENQKFNDSLSATRVGKMKQKTYNLLPKGLMHVVILKKKITRKEDIGGNIEIPCKIGGLKHTNALVDQGSNVNIMPFSIYNKLTNERPAETDFRLSLDSHSYMYPLGIAEDVSVDVVGYVYFMDFVILDIRVDEKRPFILGTPF